MDKSSERRTIGNWEAVANICNTFTFIKLSAAVCELSTVH